MPLEKNAHSLLNSTAEKAKAILVPTQSVGTRENPLTESDLRQGGGGVEQRTSKIGWVSAAQPTSMGHSVGCAALTHPTDRQITMNHPEVG
jgi:hypothetical protein